MHFEFDDAILWNIISEDPEGPEQGLFTMFQVPSLFGTEEEYPSTISTFIEAVRSRHSQSVRGTYLGIGIHCSTLSSSRNFRSSVKTTPSSTGFREEHCGRWSFLVDVNFCQQSFLIQISFCVALLPPVRKLCHPNRALKAKRSTPHRQSPDCVEQVKSIC